MLDQLFQFMVKRGQVMDFHVFIKKGFLLHFLKVAVLPEPVDYMSAFRNVIILDAKTHFKLFNPFR